MNSENNVLNEKSTSVKSKIEEAVQGARQRLLGVDLKNRFLNYRTSRRRTIRVVDEIPKEIFDILVLHPRKMEPLLKKLVKSGKFQILPNSMVQLS